MTQGAIAIVTAKGRHLDQFFGQAGLYSWNENTLPRRATPKEVLV
jgi:hypothetical protein